MAISKAIGIELKQGFLGQASRQTPIPEIQTRPASVQLAFGQPVIVTADGKYAPFTGTDISKFAGVCCRSVMQATNYLVQDGETGYAPNLPANALKKGFIIVNVGESTPAPNGAVYVTSAGAFTATASGNTLLPNCTFSTGKKDANNNCELEVGYLPVQAPASAGG